MALRKLASETTSRLGVSFGSSMQQPTLTLGGAWTRAYAKGALPRLNCAVSDSFGWCVLNFRCIWYHTCACGSSAECMWPLETITYVHHRSARLQVEISTITASQRNTMDLNVEKCSADGELALPLFSWRDQGLQTCTLLHIHAAHSLT